MSLRPSAVFCRLVVLVASIFLLTSRTMLLLHELVGHGALATALGGHVTGWRLYVFAGGRVSYRTEGLGLDRRLMISLGGIALELVLGAVAIVVARRLRERRVVAFALWCAASVVIAHAALYLARGVHYGFGDGWMLAARLGERRWLAVLPASAIAVAIAFVGARRASALPASVFAGSASARKVAGATLLVFVLGGLVHGVLSFVEVRYFPDATWVAIMEDDAITKARAELAQRVAEARRRGEALTTDEQQRILEELARANRPLPLDPLLLTAVLGAVVVGVRRGVRDASEREGAAVVPSWREVRVVGMLLAVALAVIVALR